MQAELAALKAQGFADWEALEAVLLEEWRRAHGTEQVTIVSAHPLASSERQLFEKALVDSDVTYEVDTSLIAGVRIEWSDRVLDCSVRGRINKLRESLAS